MKNTFARGLIDLDNGCFYSVCGIGSITVDRGIRLFHSGS